MTASIRPWYVDVDNCNGITVLSGAGDLVHHVSYEGIPEERGAGFRESLVQEIRANAYIISAARDLLDACERMLLHIKLVPCKNAGDKWRAESSVDGWIVDLRAAVAKAKAEPVEA